MYKLFVKNESYKQVVENEWCKLVVKNWILVVKNESYKLVVKKKPYKLLFDHGHSNCAGVHVRTTWPAHTWQLFQLEAWAGQCKHAAVQPQHPVDGQPVYWGGTGAKSLGTATPHSRSDVHLFGRPCRVSVVPEPRLFFSGQQLRYGKQ